jgi:hypothetical protein
MNLERCDPVRVELFHPMFLQDVTPSGSSLCDRRSMPLNVCSLYKFHYLLFVLNKIYGEWNRI